VVFFFAAGFLAFFFLREALEFLQILGGVLVVSAVVLLQIQQERDPLAAAIIRTQNADG